MRKRFLQSAGWLAAVFLITFSTVMAQSTDPKPVVRAVLFYSPTCPHCHAVIQNLLVPMVEQYGGQLQIMAINTTEDIGSTFYQSAIDYYRIPAERRGVPTLIVGNTILVGSSEIPEKFPGIVETALTADGIDWPTLPGMAEVVAGANTPQAVTPVAAETPISTPQPAQLTPEILVATETPMPATVTPEVSSAAPSSLAEALKPAEADPVGMALGWIVLVGLVAALGFAGRRMAIAGSDLLRLQPAGTWRSWIFPLLVMLGLGVAGYLAYVEINQVEAVCGPVGECNVVQASPYARILGIPVAVLGLLNYLTLLGLWAGCRFVPGKWAGWALPALTLVGVIFSVYLTVLEIFVIQAVCLWCLSSAVLTTLLMLLVWGGAVKEPVPFPQN